jgi:hypothetical protein
VVLGHRRHAPAGAAQLTYRNVVDAICPLWFAHGEGIPVRIRPIVKDDASEPVRRIYDALERRTGRVSNLNKMLAHKPDVLRAFGPFYAAIWAAGALSNQLKTLAYLRVSILNGCVY